MKLTILWSALASYSVAFFEALARSQHLKLQLVYRDPLEQAPYKDFDLSFCTMAICVSTNNCRDIAKAVSNFSPDCVLMSSWNFNDYMRIARKLRGKGVVVVSSMDNQWRGSLKQWLGVLSSRWFLKPSIDNFLVPGDRQAFFARKLGYENIMFGICAAAVQDFKTIIPVTRREPSFLFVGRLAAEKGIENLIRGYRMYTDRCAAPWDLKIAGTGKLQSLLGGTPGIKYLGFVQPDHLPQVMHAARALILPSIREPWGVVIHEAAAAGLPIIATHECGAVASFVRDGINGFVIPPRPSAIRDAMLKMTFMETTRIENMGNVSQILAGTVTPEIISQCFAENIKDAVNRRVQQHDS